MLPFRSLHEIREAINRQELDLPSLVESYLERIEERKNLNVFVEVFDMEALDSARLIQDKIAGIPAISLPLGMHSNSMPFGIQLMTRSFNETELLKFSKYILAKFNTLA